VGGYGGLDVSVIGGTTTPRQALKEEVSAPLHREIALVKIWWVPS